MVLQPLNRRRIGRLASDIENRKPSGSVSGAHIRRKHAPKPLFKQDISSNTKAARVPGSLRVFHDSRRRTSSAIAQKRVASLMHKVKPEQKHLEVAPIPASESTSTSLSTVTFPRTLVRPEPCNPSREALEAAGVDSEVDLDYMRSMLWAAGTSMMNVLTGLSFGVPPSQIPASIEVTVNNLSGEMPTHAFAVWPLLPAGEHHSTSAPVSVRIYPFHGSVVAANAAHLPALPPSTPTPPAGQGATMVLPVVPLGVPAPASFKPVLQYMYLKDPAMLFESIFSVPVVPCEGQSAKELVHSYAEKIAAQSTVQEVIASTMLAYGIWKNACFLGVSDNALWEVLNVSWEILMTALAHIAGKPKTRSPPTA